MVIPVILLILSLLVIGVIVVRKLPQLSLLDLDTVPEVKQEKKKNKLLRKRQEKTTKEINEKAQKVVKPVVNSFKVLQKEFRNYVSKVQRTVEKEEEKITEKKVEEVQKAEPPQKKIDSCTQLLKDAKLSYEHGSYVDAEKMCIASIKQNPKCIEAYQILGDVYAKQDQTEEAEQTFQFLLQLDERNEYALVRLAEIAEERGEFHKAVDYYQEAVLINDSLSSRFQRIYDLLMKLEEHTTALEAAKQAVSIEPDNPKYLDNLVEASIIVGDKALASDAYERLRMVNPDNQKLSVFKERIKKIA